MAGRLEVAVDEVIPALAVGVAHFGIAVARQVHKVAVVHRIEVDGSRFARRTGHARQIFAAAQLVDQAGFAHVGAPRKAQLRAVTLGQLAGNAIAGNKICFIEDHGVFLSVFQQTAPGWFFSGAAGMRFSPALDFLVRGRPAVLFAAFGLSRAAASTCERFCMGRKVRFFLTSSSTS